MEGEKLWVSQTDANRTASCAGTRGWVGTQPQLEGTTSVQHTEQWLPSTGVLPARPRLGRTSLEGLSVPHQGVGEGLSPSLPVSPLTHGLAAGSFSLSENSHRKLRSFFCCVGSREKGHFSYFQLKSFFLLDKRPQTTTVPEEEQGRRQMDHPHPPRPRCGHQGRSMATV